MKDKFLVVLVLACSIFGFAQNSEFIYPNFIGKDLQFINDNEDWSILKDVSADINSDGKIDRAIILETKNNIYEKRCASCKLTQGKARTILIVMNSNNVFQVVTQNNKFIARADEGGMSPYLEPELKLIDNLLIVSYQYTRGNQSYSFKYKDGGMFIISAESMHVHSATGNYISNKFDFIKQELYCETGNISEAQSKKEVFQFNKESKSLSEFEEMYSWEIIKKIHLNNKMLQIIDLI